MNMLRRIPVVLADEWREYRANRRAWLSNPDRRQPRTVRALHASARHTPPTPDELTLLIQHLNPKDLSDLADKYPDSFTPQHWDAVYAHSPYYLGIIAADPRTPPEFLIRLCSHPDDTVRKIAYYNPSAPEEAQIIGYLGGVDPHDPNPPTYQANGNL